MTQGIGQTQGWDDEPAKAPTPPTPPTDTLKATETATATVNPPQSPASAAGAPQAPESAPEATERRKPGRKPRAAGEPAPEPKALADLSLLGLRKEASRLVAKAKAGVAALDDLEKVLETLEAKLG